MKRLAYKTVKDIAKNTKDVVVRRLAEDWLVERHLSQDGRRRLRHLAEVARQIVEMRACVCNKPGHRCGTNLMLDDIESALKV